MQSKAQSHKLHFYESLKVFKVNYVSRGLFHQVMLIFDMFKMSLIEVCGGGCI